MTIIREPASTPDATALALQALGWVLSDGPRADRFLTLTGLTPEELRVLQRYAAQKESRGIGRMTTTEAHQNALRGMLDTLDRIQNWRLADKLTIYRRGGEVVHSFDLTGPARAGEPRARELVERERNRPLSPQEAQYKQREIERLTPILQKHGVIPARDPQRSPDLAHGKDRAPSPPRRDEDRER